MTLNKFSLILNITVLTIGLFLGNFIKYSFFSNSTNSTNNIESQNNEQFEVHVEGYKLINPLLQCEYGESLGGTEFKILEDKLNDYKKDKVDNSGVISHLSVYFRDLKNGPWVGLAEKESFAPASLLKVPIMITYLKSAEKDLVLLNKELLFNGTKSNIPQSIIPSQKLEAGKSYTVDNLIERMIIYSDNDARALLLENIDRELMVKVFKELGITSIEPTNIEDYLSIKSYSTIFRVLYNASYLNRDMSEKALEILSKIEFKAALRSGVPENVIVAHKFGERELSDANKQLHDCGIVYYKDHPYLLCIMTRGKDLEKLSNVSRDISQLVYEEVDKKYRK